MKIKINSQITVEPIIIRTYTCPAGTAYWQIDYRHNGITIHSAHTKAIYGTPNPVAMLDEQYERRVECTADTPGAVKWSNCDTGDHYMVTSHPTHRQSIEQAIAQLVAA